MSYFGVDIFDQESLHKKYPSLKLSVDFLYKLNTSHYS